MYVLVNVQQFYNDEAGLLKQINNILLLLVHNYKSEHVLYCISNGNASETKANESFDIGVFFDIEAKRPIASKLFSKRSEHIR